MEVENEGGQDEVKIWEDYESVCSKLNMDKESMDSAWKSYTDIRDYYTLEVSQINRTEGLCLSTCKRCINIQSYKQLLFLPKF